LTDIEGESGVQVEMVLYNDVESEVDEQWSYVQNKDNQRWLWLAIHHETRVVLAYTLGKRADDVFLELKGLLEPFGITIFYTDGWGAYQRHLTDDNNAIGKENTQRIERKNLTLRTRCKRLARKTICFSKCEFMHDIVVGLIINFIEFSFFHVFVELHF